MCHSLIVRRAAVKALVRGATGFAGFRVAKTLQQKGVKARALIRAGSDTSDLVQLEVERKKQWKN